MSDDVAHLLNLLHEQNRTHTHTHDHGQVYVLLWTTKLVVVEYISLFLSFSVSLIIFIRYETNCGSTTACSVCILSLVRLFLLFFFRSSFFPQQFSHFQPTVCSHGVFYPPDWIMFIPFYFINIYYCISAESLPLQMLQNQTESLGSLFVFNSKMKCMQLHKIDFCSASSRYQNLMLCAMLLNKSMNFGQWWQEKHRNKKCNVLCHHVHSHLQFRLSRLHSIFVVVPFLFSSTT